ncbi:MULTISPECIES: DUF4099 domain-containing protein [Mucilaginibacter]|nr:MULTISPECIES: DUF4099 domain-containing protein [Mucilaginibacter]QTF64630.1 DUF4099 domain-containing protein [Mucilaginibacter rubeus]
MRNSFALHELSDSEMRSLGLYDQYGDLRIEPEDLDVLLSGRRTSLMRLHDLTSNGMNIAQMDAKLSLHRDSEGQAFIRVHPVYHQPKLPFAGEDDSIQALLDGRELHARYRMATAVIAPEVSKEYEYIYEYDAETREFISYAPEKVPVPDRINGFELSPAQKLDFSRAIPLTLPDGTSLVYKATDSNGLLANRWSLILSKDTEDGRAYELLEGIRPLGTAQIAEESPAFKKENDAMNAAIQPTFQENLKVSGRKR